MAWKEKKEEKQGKKETRKRKEGKKEKKEAKGTEGKKSDKGKTERKKKNESQRKKVKGKRANKHWKQKGFLYTSLGVLGQTPTKEGNKEEKGRKEGKKGYKRKTDRKIVRERKEKGRKGKQNSGKHFWFLLFIFVCYWAKNNPTLLSQKS